MSNNINVSISGEIIESQNYLSNYFVTLTSDQTITGNKIFSNITNIDNVSTLNFINGQMNASTLDISTNILSFNGNSGVSGQVLKSNGYYPIWSDTNSHNYQTFGSQDISFNDCSGHIEFTLPFPDIPCVTITQKSNRLVPIFITNVTDSYFEWGAASRGVGTIMWSAGLKS